MLITMISLMVIRCFQDGLHVYIDNFLATPSDFSLMIRGIPDSATKDDIEEMVDEMRGFLSPEEKT